MTINIAVAGKGGVGKTAFSTLLIKNLNGTILAVDADPNVNLNVSLGIPAVKHIGIEREKAKNTPVGVSKQDHFKLLLNQSLYEGDKIDLLVMGRGEGKGCYCYSNSLLRQFIDTLQPNYDFVVIDTEAGMEHISRRTTQDINHLFIISEPTVKGLQCAERVIGLTKELELSVDNIYLVINKVNTLPDVLQKKAAELGKPVFTIPYDKQIMQYDIEGKPHINLPETSLANKAVVDIINKVIK